MRATGSRGSAPADRRPTICSKRASATARSMQFWSSRTLPGHAYASSFSAAARRDAGRRACRARAANCSRKCCASSSTSLPRARSGGSSMLDDVDAVVEVLAEALAPRPPSRGRGWSRRRCARRTATSSSPPTGRTVRSCSARRSFGCIVERHLADLVEEERAAAWPARTGPRASLRASVKAPCTWPKSSLSSSASGIAAQLTATKGRLLRRLRAMERARDELLARAALAGDEHRRRRSRRRGRAGRRPAVIGRARAEEVVEARRALGDRAPQALDLLAQRAVLRPRARAASAQRVELERLGDEVVRAGADRGDRRLEAAEGGDDDDRHVRRGWRRCARRARARSCRAC